LLVTEVQVVRVLVTLLPSNSLPTAFAVHSSILCTSFEFKNL